MECVENPQGVFLEDIEGRARDRKQTLDRCNVTELHLVFHRAALVGSGIDLECLFTTM